jgi:hypothetical protein
MVQAMTDVGEVSALALTQNAQAGTLRCGVLEQYIDRVRRATAATQREIDEAMARFPELRDVGL